MQIDLSYRTLLILESRNKVSRYGVTVIKVKSWHLAHKVKEKTKAKSVIITELKSKAMLAGTKMNIPLFGINLETLMNVDPFPLWCIFIMAGKDCETDIYLIEERVFHFSTVLLLWIFSNLKLFKHFMIFEECILLLSSQI